jgi:excisionase family DNA binding protein
MDFMSVGDVAKRCGVSSAAVRLWERSGKLVAIRTSGGVRLFHRDDVERFHAERTRTGATELREAV